MTGAADIGSEDLRVDRLEEGAARLVPREKKSADAESALLDDAEIAAGCSCGRDCAALLAKVGVVFTDATVDVLDADAVGLLAAGLRPSIALNASLFLPFGLLLSASDTSGDGLRIASSTILNGASAIDGVSDSSTLLSAFLATLQ